jgi:hypothetical protein
VKVIALILSLATVLSFGFTSLNAKASDADGFRCFGFQKNGESVSVFAAVVDVGDEEGEMWIATGNKLEYVSTYYNGFTDDNGNSGADFIAIGENVHSQSDGKQSGLTLDATGTKGLFDNVVNGSTSNLECTPSVFPARYLARAAVAAWKYEVKGEDNNSLEVGLEQKSALEFDKNALELPKESVFQSAKICSFNSTGAYGKHLSSKIQNEITAEFLKSISKLAQEDKQSIKFFQSSKVFGDSLPVLEKPCSLLVEINGKYTLHLNPLIMD